MGPGAETGAMAMEPEAPMPGMPGQPAGQGSAPITGATTIFDLVSRGLGVNQAPQAPAMAQPGMPAPRVPQLPPMPQLPTPTGPQILPQYAGADSRANFAPGGTPQLMPEAQARVDLANAPTFDSWANQLQQMGIASNPAAGTFGTGARQPQLPPMPQLPTPSGIPSGLAAPQAAPQASPYGNPQIGQAGVQALPGPQAPGGGQGAAAPAQQVQAQAQPPVAPVAPAPAAGPAPAPAVDPVVADLQRQVAELRARIPAAQAPAAPAPQQPPAAQADPGRPYDPSRVEPQEVPESDPIEQPQEVPEETPELEPAFTGSPLTEAKPADPIVSNGSLSVGGKGYRNAKAIPASMLQKIGVSQAILSQFVEHAQVGVLKWFKPTIDNEADAAALAYEFLRNQAQESMLVILADKNGKPISVLRHTLGGMGETQYHSNIMAGVAAGTPGCRKVYVVHNHPSGTMKFSSADMMAAVAIQKLLEGVGVQFAGSLVVGDAQNDPGNRGEGAYGPRYIFHPGDKDTAKFLNTYPGDETLSKPITLAEDTPGGDMTAGYPVALTERVFKIRGNALAPRVSNGSESVRAIVPLLARKPGIAFLDKGGRIMGVLPLSLAEMTALATVTNKRGTLGIAQSNTQRLPRTTSSTIDVESTAQDNPPLARILTVMERANADGIIISIGDSSNDSQEAVNANRNVRDMAARYKISVLDTINNERNFGPYFGPKQDTLGGANTTPKLPTGDRMGFREGDEEYDPAPIEGGEEQAAQDYPEVMANRKATQRADGGEDGGAGIEGIVRNGLEEGNVSETNPEDPNAGAEFARQEREAGARVNQDSGLENATPAEPIIKKTRKPRAKPAAPNPSAFPTKLDSTLPFGRLTGEQMKQFGLSDAMLDQFVEHSTTGHVMSGVEFVKSAEDAAHVVAGLRKRPQEQVILLITDKNGRPIQIAEHMLSQPQACGFNPGILIGTAASTPGAAKVWFIHNHPSGKPSLSPADISAGGNIQKLTEAANLKFEGTMAIAGTRFAQLTPSGRIESNLAIKAAPRKFKVPITERMFAFRVSQSAKQISDPAIAMAEAERIFGQTQPGIMLLDNSNRLVATIPLAADVLQAMKAKIPGTDQTGFNRYVAGIDRSNPVNAMIYTADVDAGVARKIIQNISGMAGATKITVLDAFGVGGISRQSDIRTYGSDFNESAAEYDPEGGQPQGEPQTLRDVVDQAAKKKNELEVGEGEPDADSMAEALKAEPIPSAADMAKLTGRLVPNHDDGLLASQGFITKRASQDMARIMEGINKRFPDGYPINGWDDNGNYNRDKKKIANLRLRYESDADPIGNYEAQDYVFIDAVFEDGTTHMIASLDLMRGYASTPESPTLVTKVGMSHVNTDLQKLGLGSILYVEGGERLRRMGQRFITGSVINPAAVATRVRAFPAGSTELLAVPGSSSMSQKEMAEAALLIIQGGTAAYTRTTLDPDVALESSQPYNQAGSYDIVFYDAAIKGFNSERNGNPDKDRSGRAIVGKDGVTFTGYKHLKDVSLTLDEWNDLMDELKSDGEARISMPDGDIVITSARKGSSRVGEDGAETGQADQLTEPAMPYDDGENMRIPGSERDERLKSREKLEKLALEAESAGYMQIGHGYLGAEDRATQHNMPGEAIRTRMNASWKKDARMWIMPEGRVIFSDTIDRLEVRKLAEWKRSLKFAQDELAKQPTDQALIHQVTFIEGMIKMAKNELTSSTSAITHSSGFFKDKGFTRSTPQGRVEVTKHGVLVSVTRLGNGKSESEYRAAKDELITSVALTLGVPTNTIRVVDIDGYTGNGDSAAFDGGTTPASDSAFTPEDGSAREPGAAYDDGENQAIPGGGRQAWLKKQAKLRAKNELPGARRIQWWTDVGHKKGKKNREKTWLWAYDKKGKLQVINEQDLFQKLVDRNNYAGIGIDPSVRATHLDWEMFIPDLMDGTAHGRIDATEPVIRISLTGRIKDSAFREQVKQELAEHIGADVDKVKGYDFTGDGMPEVFEPGADYGSSDPVLTQEREVANHADEDLAARGFITREATKMDLPGAKLEIYPMKVRSRTIPVSDEFKAANPHIDWEAVENDNKPDDIYKGHIIYKGKKIAVFDFSMQEDNDHMELEWIKVNPTYRGLGLSKVIIAEITERAKRTGLGEVYSLVVDPQNRPISALESLLGAENVEWSGGDFDETHGRDPFRQQDPDTGEWFVERKDVTAKIPNKYSADELKLLDDIKKGFDERKNLAKWKKIQAKKGAKLLNQTQAGSDAEVRQLAQDLKGMDLDEAKAYFKKNPDKVILLSQPGLPPHLEKLIKAMREIGYNDAKAYLEAHPLGKLLLANGRIVLVRDASEIPGISPLEAATAGFNAMVFPTNREATYFVGDMISQAELDALIKHEVGVHMGIGKDTDLVNDLYAELYRLIETGASDDIDRMMAGDAVMDAFNVVAGQYGRGILAKINEGGLSPKERYTDARITSILKEKGLTQDEIDNFLRMFHEETLGYLMNVMARRDVAANAPKDGLFAMIIRWIKATIIRMAYAGSEGGERARAGKAMRGIGYASLMADSLGMKKLSQLLEIRPGDVRAIAQGYVRAYASGKEVGMPDTRKDTVEGDTQEAAKDAQEARVRGRASDPVTSAATFFNKRENRASDRTLSGREAFAAEARANPQPDAPGSATQVEKGQMDWEEKPGAISEFAPMANVSGSVALSEARNPTGDTRDSSLLVADEAGNKIEFPKISSMAVAAGLPADVAALLDVPIYITQGRQGTGADGKFGRGAQADPEGQGSSGYGLEHVDWKHGWQLDALASEGKWEKGNAINAVQKIMASATHISVAINPDGSVFGVNVYSAQTTMTVVLRMSTGSNPILHVQTAFPGSNVVKDNGKVNENNLKKPLKLDDFKKSMARNSPEGSTILASGADAGQQTNEPGADYGQDEQTGEQQAAAEAETLEKLREVQGNGPAGPRLFNAIPPTPPPPAPTTPTSPAPAPLNPPATADDMARRVGDVLRGRYFDGISTKAHQNAERTGSAAVRAIADIIHTRPGTESPSSERDLPKAIMSARIKYQNKFNQIMRPLRDQLSRMTSEQREQFYRELVDQITGRTNIQPGVAGHAATQLIDLLKELHDYRTAAGENLGQVQQYFPAVYNSELITANRTAFIADATRAYEIELSQDPTLTPQEIQAKAAAAAAALYRTHTRGMGDAEWASIFNSGQNSSTENSSKERVFGRQAQGIMSKWQTPDPFYVISRYIGSAVKRAELVRRFGPEGQNWEAMSNAMEADGVPIETINEMSQLVRLAAGLGSTPLDNSERMFMDTVNLYTAAAAMGKSAMNNLFEPSAMGIRASTVGNPFRTVSAYAETWARFVRNLVQMLPVLGEHVGPTFWQEYGEHIGSIHNSLDDAWMSMHAMEHGMEESNPAMRWITNRVYQANLMESTENAKLQASHALGHAYILDHTSMLDGSHYISRLLKFDTRSTAEEALLELGIPKSKQDAFAAWCATLKQTKDRGARMAMLTDGSEMARLYEEAQIRFSHQSAVRANRAHKPVFQDAVLGRLALQLMSFSYSYFSEVTDRMYRMARRAITTNNMPAIQRINMMLPLMLSPLTVVAMGALFESKDYLFPTESSEKRKKDHWIYKLFNASSFAGMFGPKLEMATKYIARDQPPGGIAGQTAVGVGRVGKKAIELAMDDTKTPAQKEAALKKAAARAAIAPIKGSAVIAGSALHPAAGAVAVAATNDTGWSNALQDVETPKKGTDPKPEGLPKYRR